MLIDENARARTIPTNESVFSPHSQSLLGKRDRAEEEEEDFVKDIVDKAVVNILLQQNDEGDRNNYGDDNNNLVRTIDDNAVHDRVLVLNEDVKEGSKIEIRWILHHNSTNGPENVPRNDNNDNAEEKEEEEEEVERDEVIWWPATVLKRNVDDHDGSEKNVLEIMYEARNEEFPAERGKIALVSEHECKDYEDATKFYWRKEGDDFTVEEDEDFEYDEEEDGDGGDFTMQELIAHQTKIDGDAEETLQDASEKAFGTLPMDKQLQIATGFAQMKDKLMGKLKQISEKNGPGYTVTKEDMDRIMQELRDEAMA